MVKCLSRVAAVCGAGIFLAVIACARGAGGRGAGGAAGGVDPVADAEAQYQRVLEVMKRPTATGVLVTEVAPESPAVAAGLRGGDIIMEYYGNRITTLASLQEQVAEAMARQAVGEATGDRVVVRVRRGTAARGGQAGQEQVMAMQLPREPLGIRAIEVEVGVPGPRNPAPSPRGTVKLDWLAVLEAAAADKAAPGAEGTVMRAVVMSEAPATTQPAAGARQSTASWSGWQKSSAVAEIHDVLAGTLDVFRLDPDNQALPPEHAAFSFRLRIGDGLDGQGFVLDEAMAELPVAAGEQRLSGKAERFGPKLRVHMAPAPGAPVREGAADGAANHEYTMPLNALVQPAVAWVAAAMPHDAEAVLGLYLASTRDFVPRPGYVLTSRGKAVLPEPDTETAWRVDLMHCGVVVESYWFSDARRVLAMESTGPQRVISRRVANAHDAQLPLESRPPAGAATLPAKNP